MPCLQCAASAKKLSCAGQRLIAGWPLQSAVNMCGAGRAEMGVLHGNHCHFSLVVAVVVFSQPALFLLTCFLIAACGFHM